MRRTITIVVLFLLTLVVIATSASAEDTISELKQKAEQGNQFAQYDLGWKYQKGVDVKKDYEEAMKWYLKSANQGNTDACNQMGWLYQYALGVKKDQEEVPVGFQNSISFFENSCMIGNILNSGDGNNKIEFFILDVIELFKIPMSKFYTY